MRLVRHAPGKSTVTGGAAPKPWLRGDDSVIRPAPKPPARYAGRGWTVRLCNTCGSEQTRELVLPQIDIAHVQATTPTENEAADPPGRNRAIGLQQTDSRTLRVTLPTCETAAIKVTGREV